MSTAVGVGIENVISEYCGSPILRRGRQFWSCPFHSDHKYSLTIFPEKRRWRCIQCNAFGDAVDFVRKLRACRFREAVSTLKGLGMRIATERNKARKHVKALGGPELPSKAWRDDASRVVSSCGNAPDGPSANAARKWLQDRGLKPETLRRWRLGYSPASSMHAKLWIPGGIIIPWTHRGSVTAIKVLRSDLSFRFQWIRGGQRVGLYLKETFKPDLPTLLVKNELDALLAWQESDSLINVATFGSFWDGPDDDAMKSLTTSPAILIAYPLEQYGAQEIQNWRKLNPRMSHCPQPDGRSLTEFFQQGGDIRAWVEEQLARTMPTAKRPLASGVAPNVAVSSHVNTQGA